MIICDDGHAPVGTLWIGMHPEHGDCAFIYDIEVDESRRGEGLGRASTAQRLYTSLDYHVVATQMTKRLE
jgi:hypothetical protein